jgi:hypothetical protein
MPGEGGMSDGQDGGDAVASADGSDTGPEDADRGDSMPSVPVATERPEVIVADRPLDAMPAAEPSAPSPPPAAVEPTPSATARKSSPAPRAIHTAAHSTSPPSYAMLPRTHS